MKIEIDVPDEPGPELYNAIRGLFLIHGTTIEAEANKQKPKIHPQNARKALLGKWNGCRARAVRQVLIGIATKPREE